MNITVKENAVINILRQWKVATKKKLCQHFNISHMTVVRALKKFGYYTSYNKNSAFYTLHDIPEFDVHGIWAYNDIYFSCYGTLEQTIVALVENSDTGFTVQELNEILKAEVKNILSRLCRQKRLSRCFSGRYAIYLSSDHQRKTKQEACRKEQIEKTKDDSSVKILRKKLLPEKLDAITVIKVLVKMIEFPKASDASISQSFQRQGVSITAKDVRRVIEFYCLEKKMEH
jgi:predicted transcriptional regulator